MREQRSRKRAVAEGERQVNDKELVTETEQGSVAGLETRWPKLSGYGSGTGWSFGRDSALKGARFSSLHLSCSPPLPSMVHKHTTVVEAYAVLGLSDVCRHTPHISRELTRDA